jgi:hypothetical protein
MSNSVGYDKYFLNQSDYIRYKRSGLYDKVQNYPNQDSYIQSIHKISASPRNELSNPCILLKEYSTPDASMVTCVFKLSDCQLKYYTSKGVIRVTSKPYTLTSKTISSDVTYSSTLQLYTGDSDISVLNAFYKTHLPLSYSYLKVSNILLKSNDIFGLPITIL